MRRARGTGLCGALSSSSWAASSPSLVATSRLISRLAWLLLLALARCLMLACRA